MTRAIVVNVNLLLHHVRPQASGSMPNIEIFPSVFVVFGLLKRNLWQFFTISFFVNLIIIVYFRSLYRNSIKTKTSDLK